MWWWMKGGVVRDTNPFWVQFFSQFHAVLGKNGQNNMFIPTPLG